MTNQIDNTQLIAAASDLLEACKLVVDRWESGDLAEAVRECSMAIANAEALTPADSSVAWQWLPDKTAWVPAGNTDNTAALNKRRGEIADLIRDALESRKIQSIETNIGTIGLLERQGSSGAWSTTLVVERDQHDKSGDLLSAICENGSYYEYGDFNLPVYNPSPSDVLRVIDHWDDIVDAFARYDNRVAAAVSTPLKQIDNSQPDPVICPYCNKVNDLADEIGHTDGPRDYHATCWGLEQLASDGLVDDQ